MQSHHVEMIDSIFIKDSSMSYLPSVRKESKMKNIFIRQSEKEKKNGKLYRNFVFGCIEENL